MTSRTALPCADDHGVSAEGVEVNALRQRGGDFRRRHDRRQRTAVADALGHSHDVGNNALRFKSPEMRAGAAKAGLHFVRDADAARRADVFISMFQITVRKNHAAADALNRFGNESSHAARRGVVNQTFDIRGVVLAGFRFGTAPLAAIGVGRDGVMHAETVRDVEFPVAVRRHAHRRHVAAVITIAQGDDVEIAGVGAGHEQGQIGGLGAGVDEVANLEIARHFGGELFGVLRRYWDADKSWWNVARFRSAAEWPPDMRMAVADADGDDAAQAHRGSGGLCRRTHTGPCLRPASSAFCNTGTGPD